MAYPEVYISIDVEADGPIPGVNSMLSFGAAAFAVNIRDPDCEWHHHNMPDGHCTCGGWKMLGTFYAKLDQLPGAVRDPATMGWWAQHPEAWTEATKDPEDPASVMARFKNWLAALDTPKKPVLVGAPLLYDGMWVYWYMVRFCGFPAPFGHQGIDSRSVAMVVLNRRYRNVGKRDYPKDWFKGAPKHTHCALDDAIEQGTVFCNMLKGRTLA